MNTGSKSIKVKNHLHGDFGAELTAIFAKDASQFFLNFC